MTSEVQVKPVRVVLDMRGRSRDPAETRVGFTITYGRGKTAKVVIHDPLPPGISENDELAVRELHDLTDALDAWIGVESPFIRS